MKKIAIVLAVIILAVACKQTSSTHEKPTADIQDSKVIAYKIVKHFRKYHLFGDETKPNCSVQLSIMEITGGLDRDQILFVRRTLHDKFFAFGQDDESLEARFEAEAAGYINNYKQLEDNIRPRDKELDYSYNWTFENTSEIYLETSRFLGFRIRRFSNTGGDFPSMTSEYVCMDIISGKLLNAEYVFVADKKEAMIALIAKKMQANYAGEAQLGDKAWRANIRLTDNIILSDSLLTLYYNSKEIAPQSMGDLELSFAIKDIASYLNPEIEF